MDAAGFEAERRAVGQEMRVPRVLETAQEQGLPSASGRNTVLPTP